MLDQAREDRANVPFGLIRAMLALVHVPSPLLDTGQRTFVSCTVLDADRAARQHRNYALALTACGAEVVTLEDNAGEADGVFLEDVAIVLDEVAVLATMGTEARQAEPGGVRGALEQHRKVQPIEHPARIEGGDVLRIGRQLLVGLSKRTDAIGAQALAAIAEPLGYTVTTVPMHGCLHLKTACTALPDGRLLVNPNWIDTEALSGFEHIWIPPEEPWGANTLPLGQTVLLPSANVETGELIQNLGFQVKSVDISEFAKAEGGVTCLSIIVSEPSA